MADNWESNTSIRAAGEADRPAIRQVRWAVGWDTPSPYHRTWIEADENWITQHYYQEYIAEVEGVIAARVGLEAYRPLFAEICDLSVRPEYQRRGLGRKLTQRCLEEAARRAFVAVFVQTERDNNAAHRLYHSLDFVPVATGKMLRMLKFINYPLLYNFRQAHPLNLYRCTPHSEKPRVWNLEWHAYITDDYVRLQMEGGASQSDSEGLGPALTAFDWRIGQGARGLSVSFKEEAGLRDLEPGHHVEIAILARNHGRQVESGVFKMMLPPGVSVSSPTTNRDRVFDWRLEPGESLEQPVVVQIEPNFDAGVLWHLNYGSVPVSMETYWEGQRALLSVSLPMAIPPPTE